MGDSVADRSDPRPPGPGDEGGIPARAKKTAVDLLEGYYFQDERESHILRNNPEKAMECQELALERLAAVYAAEFPQIGVERAEEAGREFMRGLFVQDEIENWSLIDGSIPLTEMNDVLLSEMGEEYAADPAQDRRWDSVQDHLQKSCELVDVDPEFAERQTRFWLLHGQLNEYWEQVAKGAQTIKLQSMIPQASQETYDRLSEQFVRGVKLHDNWEHQEKSADFEDIVEVVAAFYEEIFDIRESSATERNL